MNCSPPGSSVHGILQARILEWVAISFSRGSSPPAIESSPGSPALQADPLPTELQGKPLEVDTEMEFGDALCLLGTNTWKKGEAGSGPGNITVSITGHRPPWEGYGHPWGCFSADTEADSTEHWSLSAEQSCSQAAKLLLEGDLADASPWLLFHTPLQHPPHFHSGTLWSGLLLPACLLHFCRNLTAREVCQQGFGEGSRKNFRLWKCYLSVIVAPGNHI